VKTVGILIFDDVEELDFTGPLEVFGMAAHFGASCRTVTIAEQRKEIHCRHGLRVVPDFSFDDAPPLDLLIVPGGLGARTHARGNAKILDFVRQQTGTVASICTGALILASAGLLDGLTATTHHNSLDLLRQHAKIDVRERTRFIMHDRVATSAGVSAGIDLALALVAREWGEAVAAKVAANMEWREESFSVRKATRDDADGILVCLRAAFEPYKSRYSEEGYEDTVPATLNHRLETMTIFVAISQSGDVIGTIACAAHGAEGHLRGMAVRSEWQGKKVADALLQAAEEELRRQDCRRITLDTTEPLQRAMRFYEKHGYRKSGRVSDFFGMPLHEYVKSL
jgi:putative intracellular protease/amidase/predicted N-acetyltransferase YhbS